MYPYYYYSHTQRGKLRKQHLRTYLKAGIAYGRHVYKAAYYPGKHRYPSRYAVGAAPALIQKHGGRSRHKPLRQAAPLSVLITAIGVSYLLQNAALLLFGSQQMAYPTLVKLGSFSVGDVQVDGITVLTLAVTAVLMVALTLFIDKTKLGKAMRAVSEDKDAATLMGISVDRTITLTFAIGSALAAFASMFYGMTYVYIKPTTGAMPGIKAFTAAVFGGIGSIPGAMIGGILLGLIEQMSKTYISTLWADAIVFAVLVVVLVVKPTGLLGKPMQEKV